MILSYQMHQKMHRCSFSDAYACQDEYHGNVVSESLNFRIRESVRLRSPMPQPPKGEAMDRVDILIIGQGPAGLSAAIYAGRAGIRTLVLGCDPKVAGDYIIDNYFGFPEPITGKELIARGVSQAERFGADMRCERVLGVHAEEEGYVVRTEAGEIATAALILATGVSRVRPGIANIADYEGKGVSYCVSCDGFFYRDKTVAVLGEGIFAANQALELLQYTPHVTIYTQ